MVAEKVSNLTSSPLQQIDQKLSLRKELQSLSTHVVIHIWETLKRLSLYKVHCSLHYRLL